MSPQDLLTFMKIYEEVCQCLLQILPEFKGSLMGHTAIFVPSYFDFVRLRNYFKREAIECAQISE